MTGHQAHNQSHGANPLRIETPDLNQQAATIATARNENNPYVQDLAPIEPKFIAELLRQLEPADHTLIGAVLLIAGQLTANVISMLTPESRPHAGPIACNLLQLAGQQLYQGKMRHTAACPFPLATGKPCTHVAKAETEDQLNAVMRGHINLHHPDQAWPVVEAAATPRCAVYWGSHGCKHPHDHTPEIPHECSCCECEQHPDAGSACVGKPPYYGEGTKFYGEDAEALGLTSVED